MSKEQFREIYARTPDGGVQFAASADRWHLYEDFVHLAPHHQRGGLLRHEAQLKPFVDSPNRQALVIIDMQNDFCSPGGWTDASGLEYQKCRTAIPGIQRAIAVARERELWVVWVYWHNRPDLRNLGAPTLYSFKHEPSQQGIGQDLARGQVLTQGSWGAEIVDDLKPLMREEDIHIEKVRMSGFYGTHLDQVLRTQGINTLLFAGVNIDQCVTTTMEDAYFRDYNAVLLEDACSTSSPDFCREAVVFNARQCWGFSMTVEQFAHARPFKSPQSDETVQQPT
ncbi:cysteine hydrolase family protein [Deinococcus peraridilitoris]|uniref:Nicotinamidase-like amidase n=1 Tax=Deinococcus peraridilitoris (strain DSM 19664 / LMG 22246 / CIP 109416 / KR-200) TaxID=937777 RepID=L0A058_DEIPD|nr:cysteine hydrolase [Deinococcus peraridilitoris]AFZ66557.1 nicotinamidase-like amidase [Deinococcus peraridilitoris DSM 19664]